jgi:hypothetical protein
MGNTGNSKTYPYGIKTVGGKDVVYNRATGEDVKSFDRYGVEATQLLNELVTEFTTSSAVRQDEILGKAKAAA